MTKRVLRRFGFRKVVFWNSMVASLSIAMMATFTPATPPVIMILCILFGGVFRALQTTSLNTLNFAEATDAEMSHATALSQMTQRIAQSTGVATAALLLHFFSGSASILTNHAFSLSFAILAILPAISSISFLSLPKNAGDVLAGRNTEKVKQSDRCV